MKNNALSLVLAGMVGGALSLAGSYFLFSGNDNNNQMAVNANAEGKSDHFKSVNYNPTTEVRNPDFTEAADRAMPAVVNITATTQNKPQNWQEYRYYKFFGEPKPSQSTGSGVVINKDGYIVTNNHVVSGASKVEVTLFDKRKFEATIVGTDPSTDLAVLKIEADDLQTMELANSDDAKIGEWVLAVGNPFELNFTVTAGIISAKGRDISILNGQSSIESFIQTDAAVNPGNSGGALVNAQGQLVGINTAIASQTGSYTGYSFAVPMNLVKKVVQDLIDYGNVKRGFLGVMIQEITAESAQKMNLATVQGVYVSELVKDGAAETAGMQPGDVIVTVNNMNIKSVSELQEKIGSRNPGDIVNITVLRNNAKKDLAIKLKD